MVSRDTCFLTLSIVSVFLIVSMDARSWDTAVAIGNEIHFYNRNGTPAGNAVIQNTTALTALAYDSANRTMYMSDWSASSPSIYNTSMTEDELSAKTVLNRTSGVDEQISSMVFDPVEKTLYWIDSSLERLMKMKVDPSNKNNTPIMLHDLRGHGPHGIALDICHRYIYWTNNEKTKQSIQRSRLNGSGTEDVLDDKRFQVFALAVDHARGKLYFSDYNPMGFQFTIEEMNLNGGPKSLLVNGTGQPVYLAVDNGTVYWTDREAQTIWKKDKHNTANMSEIRSFGKTHPEMLPMSIITRDNAGDIDCSAILEREKKEAQTTTTTTTTTKTTALLPRVSNRQTTEKIIISVEPRQKDSSKALNVVSTTIRSCEEGSTDCGASKCLNYCVHGECIIDNKGSPRCECGGEYKGERCERDICEGYCLNDGSCSVTAGEPTCKCENSWGSRCQYNVNQMGKDCETYCLGTSNRMNAFSATICRCSELNETLSDRYDDSDSLISSTILLSVLIVLVAALVVVVGVLSYHVNKLRRRPRIRKRFVVQKNGVTPLTSRPQHPSDSCEITIENCCNMNICETPCFEPKVRSSPTKSKKGEEKSSLLDGMEGADSC